MDQVRSAMIGTLTGLLVLAIGFVFWTRPAPVSETTDIMPAPRPKSESNQPKPPPKANPPHEEAIIDSNMTFEEATANQSFPPEIVATMQLVDVEYLGFDGKRHKGQIVIHRDLAEEVEAIFAELLKAEYPIEKVIPIVTYNWNDAQSIADNNTSAFNYREVITPAGKQKEISQHGYGRAIDLNPYQNPYVDASGRAQRPYDPEVKGTLTAESTATRIFLSYGWEWGGHWKGGKDYQHFVKEAPSKKLN